MCIVYRQCGQSACLCQGRIQRTVFFFLGGGGSLGGGGLTYPHFQVFPLILGHFILKLLDYDIYFLFYVKFLSLFSRLGRGPNRPLRPLGGHGPMPPPLDPPMASAAIAAQLTSPDGSGNCILDTTAAIVGKHVPRTPGNQQIGVIKGSVSTAFAV